MGNFLSKSPLVHDPATLGTPLGSGDHATGRSRQFDYIVVGGGTAGSVLASRLSEDPSVTVLLVEAGKSNENVLMSRVPVGFTKLFGGECDWGYETTPQARLNNRNLYWPRGKILGGSSAINALIYHHCAPEDFDAWVEQGATGWGYENMKKYFRKAETYNPANANLHGDSGPWKISHVELAPMSKTILQAAQKLGVPHTQDFNTPEGTLGVGPFAAFINEKHERNSTATAYLDRTVLQRPNLTVAVTITTEKILFSKDADGSIRSTGIQISSNRKGPRYQLDAKKEVIVCAGAIGSPQLLMLSGVGPEAHLKEIGIPVIKDLPAVGQNLLDHISGGAMILRAKAGTTLDSLHRPLSAALALVQWMMFGTGVMSALTSQIGLFVRSDDESLPFEAPGQKALKTTDHSSGSKAPDVEIVTVPFTVINGGFSPPAPGVYGITTGAILLKPESSGTIRLQSADIWDKPIIDANYFATESDLNIILRSTRLILRLARTEPLASLLDLRTVSETSDFGPYWPSDVDPDKVTDDDLKTWIMKHAQTAWHPTSTVKMGQLPASSAVDPELRVHGISGLRVVDASVFPDQVSGHPCAVVVALAERAADLIKGSRSSH